MENWLDQMDNTVALDRQTDFFFAYFGYGKC